jgi:WD40 repeat protein
MVWVNGGAGLLVGCGSSSSDAVPACVAALDLRERSGSGGGGGPAPVSFPLPGLPRGEGLASLAMSEDNVYLAAAAGPVVAVYDVRAGLGTSLGSGRRPLALYEDAHSDPVSQLLFHPTLAGHLLSAADDGLVNVFDTRVAAAEDAIVETLSVGNSVKKMGLFGGGAGAGAGAAAASGALAWTITRTEGLLLWSLGTALPVADFSGMRTSFLAAGSDLSELLTCHYDGAANELHCLAANPNGGLALLNVGLKSCSAKATFSTASGGHRAPIRSASWLGQSGQLVTGAEDGLLCLWTKGTGAGAGASVGAVGAGAGAAASSSTSSSSRGEHGGHEDGERPGFMRRERTHAVGKAAPMPKGKEGR